MWYQKCDNIDPKTNQNYIDKKSVIKNKKSTFIKS